MKASIHPKEKERLAALACYDILDTPSEAEYDDIATLIATICDTPIAVVNLIANGRQWFKAEVGIGVREMPLEPSICAHAILLEDLLVVPDTTKDPRFIDNPLVVGEPGLRFYAGALLKTAEGLPLGTLCVLDLKPRELSSHQLGALRILAHHVMNLLEMRKTHKLEVELSREVEKSLQAQTRMVETVSHDLRGPLNTIALSSEIIRQYDDPGLHDVAARLDRMSQQMASLIDDLNDHRVLETGEFALQCEKVDVAALLGQVEDEYSLHAENAGLKLSVDCSPGVEGVLADKKRCRQILDNLVRNAVKFTPAGGCVGLRAQPCEEGVRFVVQDTGIGIATEDIDKILEPHWRAPEAAGHPGTGLGLSIVNKLARAHGARLEIASEPGKGSRFGVVLPAVSMPRSATA